NHVGKLTLVSALIGAVSGWIGATLSALYDDLPAGAIIVLVAAGVFIISMIFGSARGVIYRFIQHWSLSRSIERQHLLRAFYEVLEGQPRTPRVAAFDQLLTARSWSAVRLRRLLRQAQRAELVSVDSRGDWRLTDEGRIEAARVVRNHRLWEMYLITHAEIAPSHVDRDADMIEHVLGPAMVAKLEKLLNERNSAAMPASPHAL
ncbi:MAG: iron dependent repressor, metal binding and dimerization domain protein, partial [Phycisphaeraceae bacterium]